MHINSKLRFIIDLYWQKLWWTVFSLYDLYKERVLYIEKASELDDDHKRELIRDFSKWVSELDEGVRNIIDSKVAILDLFIKNKGWKNTI